MIKPTDVYSIKGQGDIGGWISPDGLFFEVEYGGHNDMASKIVEDYLHMQPRSGAYDYLEEQGWIRLETDGYIFHSFQATVQQANIMYYFHMVSTSPAYKQEISKYLVPDLVTIGRSQETMPAVPMQGDQENMPRRRWRMYA